MINLQEVCNEERDRGIDAFMKRIHVAICDLEADSIKLYEKMCREFGQKKELDLAIKTYSDGKSLLEDIRDPDFCNDLDILLVEIYLKSMSGIEVAKIIRDAGFKGAIIFVSNPKDNQYYEDMFDVKAFNFIFKNNDNTARFEDVLYQAIKAIGKMKSEYLMLNYAGERCKIDTGTIRYFEIQGDHLIRVYYEDTNFTFFSTMGKLEKQLSGRQFCRSHNSFIVSLDYISKLDGNEILMKDGKRIPTSRSYKPRVVELWEKW